jgi:arylsulfatase A-like enzyme
MPFSGWKRYHLEGGHRVPFFVSWPGHIEGNRIEKRLTSSLDLFPTIAAVAGIDLPKERPIDGVNLIPYLNGEKTDAPHDSLFWRAGANFAVRDGKWKLMVVNKTTTEALEAFEKSGSSGLLNGGPYQGISPLGQHVVLYDLEADPSETTNLAGQHPDVLAGLLKKFEDWNKANVPSNAKSTRGIPTTIDGQAVQLAF